jgi:hypothetical protein
VAILRGIGTTVCVLITGDADGVRVDEHVPDRPQGAEPLAEHAVHPRFLDLLEWALANEPRGHREGGGFELYVQFDGPQAAGQLELRGADLRAVRERAIDGAGALGVPSTLAMTVTPATRPHLGDTLRFALPRPHCRGLVFQPVFTSGRGPRVETSLPMAADAGPAPISVGDVVGDLVAQSDGLLEADDFTPLPCGDPNCHTIGYLLRTPDGPVGLSRLLDVPALQGFLGDRLDYDLDDLARCGCETEPLGRRLHDLELGPEHPLRIFIKPFMDARTFDQDRIDRCCTHVIRPDGSLDSFCRYYLEGGAAGAGG